MMATMDANVELVFGDDDRVQAFAVSKDAQGREFARVELAVVPPAAPEAVPDGDQIPTGTSPVVGSEAEPDKRVQKYAANKKRVLENAG